MVTKVPIFRQKKGSVECGPVCLKMLYHYYGKKRSLKEILSEVRMYKIGTYATELGKSLLSNGFDVMIVVWDSRIFSQDYKDMSKDKLKGILKRRLKTDKKHKRFLKGFLTFIEGGGKLKLRAVTINNIKNAIKNGNPPILCIERRSLYGKKKGDQGHFVIATAINDNRITIHDPHSRYGGIHTYSIDEFMYALYSWRGYAVFPMPK